MNTRSFWIIAVSLGLVILFSVTTSVMAQKPATLTFAYEDTNSFPWVFDDKGDARGLDIELVQLLEKKLKITIKLVKLPWNRCLAMMRSGTVDGVIGSSFKPDRLNMGAYPTKNGWSNESTDENEIDTTKRIHTSGYSLYRIKGNKIAWDGNELHNPGNQSIAAQAGFTISADLKKMGATVVEVPDDASLIFRALIKKHFGAAAIQTTTAGYILNKNLEYGKIIEKCSVDRKPFHQKPYYLMLSFPFIEKYPSFARDIWRNIEKVRESDTYQTRQKTFFRHFPRVLPSA